MLQLSPFTPGAPVTKPGLFAIDEATYHADRVCETPSLSSSLARVLLNESPLHAWHKHPRLNVTPEDEADETKTTMDVGKVLHAMLLGNGAEVAVIDAKDWKSKGARDERDVAREAGLTPILAKDYKRARELLKLARQQAANYAELPDLLGPGTIFEHVAVWQEQGIWCRAMLDMIHVYADFIAIVDFKSTERSAAPIAIDRQIFNMGYDVQLAFYRRGVMRLLKALHGSKAPRVRCFLMSQERMGPGALSIVELDRDVLSLADKKVAAALQLWKTCLTADQWPAYPPFVGTVTLPVFVEKSWLDREVADDALAEAGYRFALTSVDPQRAQDADVLQAG